MNKISLLIMLLCAALWNTGAYAQKIITIDEMFALADQNSKSLRHYSTGINEAHEAINVAKNARLPEIDLSLSVSFLGDGYLFDRNFTNGITAPIPHFGNNFALEVSQVIYSGGAISSGIAIAKLQEENARLDFDENRNKVHFQLVGYYLDLYKQKNLLQVYEQNIEQTRQVLQEIRLKSTEGILLQNDVTRYELLLANLELACTQIRNSVTILNNNLTTMLGLSDTEIEPDKNIISKIMSAENEEYWTNIAEQNSTALKKLSLATQITEQQQKIIKADRLPKIALVAGDFLDGPITMEVPPINKNFNYWFVGVGLKYKLSSLYQTQKSINQSKFAIQRTKEQYDEVQEQAELAVKANFIKFLETYEQLKTQQKSVELANQNYAVVSNRYKNDMALITDMLDASNAKLSAEVQLSNAQINIIFNYYKLLYISGTL
ncbi:MAG: TolC family protein [Prevotellaceae bacterium]|jgi:outer membrane protein TolC|nr:TolC family protein [Prevotellaceae bacterium]